MKTAKEFFNSDYKKKIKKLRTVAVETHQCYMDFAEAYADYVAEKVKAFHKLPKRTPKTTLHV